jgi:hypothetical protein
MAEGGRSGKERRQPSDLMEDRRLHAVFFLAIAVARANPNTHRDAVGAHLGLLQVIGEMLAQMRRSRRLQGCSWRGGWGSDASASSAMELQGRDGSDGYKILLIKRMPWSVRSRGGEQNYACREREKRQ